MKLTTEDMRARGYDPETIANEERLQAHYRAGLSLIPIIAEAFTGVKLGDGVGLSEGRAIDDYEDAATRAACRAVDEKDDWSRLTSDQLSHFSSSLSFFDQAGMRFHLPAFLIADLRDQFGFGMAFWLTYTGRPYEDSFGLLSVEQRAAFDSFSFTSLSHRSISVSGPTFLEHCETTGYDRNKPSANKGRTKRMQARARRLSVVSATSCARRRLIRVVRPRNEAHRHEQHTNRL